MKTIKFRLAAGFAAFAIAAAPAWAFTWTGAAGNGLMSDPGNWAEANAPSSATDVAAFDLPSDTTVSFDLGASPVIEKSGAGKLTLSGGSGYNGEVRLYGGALDLGGGKANMVQASRTDSPVFAGDTSLYNATVKYTGVAKAAGNYKQDQGYLTFKEGTVTIGPGADFTMDAGLLPYQTDAETGFGARTVVVDGGTLKVNSTAYVIGADNDWSKAARLDLKNHAKATIKNNLIVGSRFGSLSSIRAAGYVSIVDSELVGDNMQFLISNEATQPGCRAIVAATNSVLSTTRGAPAVALNNFKRPTSDVQFILNNSTYTGREIQLHGQAYTGSESIEGRQAAGKTWTGVLTLDGGTLKPLQASAQYIYNNATATDPAVELLAGGGTIDTAVNVTIPAVAFGEGGWTKKGSGTLTLSGANLYAGATRVEAGTLVLTGSIAGGIAVAGGTFETSVSGTYPSLLMDGGTAAFSGNSPFSFSSVEIGPNGGTLVVPVKGFTFNGVTGAENLSALTLSASPSGWGTGEVMYSDDSDFLEWAAGQIGNSLPTGFSASADGSAVVISATVAIKTTTWTGAGSDALWSTDANWDEGAPSTADTVVLDGTTNTDTELESGLAPAAVAFAETAGEFSVTGLGSLSVASAVSNNSANAQAFGVPVACSGANCEIHANGNIAFNGGVSGVSLVKTGPGTATFGSSYTGKLDIEEGGIALASADYALTEGAGDLVIGGALDLGGGTLALSQPDSDDFILKDGAVLKNGSFTYESAKTVYRDSNLVPGFMFGDGTVTIGDGATVSFNGALFPYGPSAPAETFGARRVLVDGGTLTLSLTGVQPVIGVNNDWEKEAVLEIANDGVVNVTGQLYVGGRNSGTGTSNAAKGTVVVRDGGTLVIATKLAMVNNSGAAKSYGVVAVTNGTIQVAGNDGVCLFGHPYAQTGANQCDARLVMNGGTVEAFHVVAEAQNGAGIMAGKSTGTVHLSNGATIRARGRDSRANFTDFIFNGAKDPTYPALELGPGGGAIDSNGFTVTDSAVMFGEGSLTKKGAGTLTLSGANTYEGGTVVEGGTLAVAEGGSISGPLVVKSGATFSCPPETLTFSSFTLEEGGAIGYPANFDFDSAPGYVVLFDVTGDLTIAEKMADGGKEIFVKQGDGVSHVCYGKRIGTVIMLR